jgi:exosome complex RNA-binding protein Rrp42 (RNase PH superfamily)
MSKPEKFFDDKGLRLDGRRIDEIRPMKIEVNENRGRSSFKG